MPARTASWRSVSRTAAAHHGIHGHRRHLSADRRPLAIFASIFNKGDGRGLLALIGVLTAIAGLVLIKKPFDTLVVFTLIVGLWFVVAGIGRFVAALASPEGRGGNIVTAILDLIAGIVILSWPDLGLSTLAVIIGIVLILRGLFFIVSGWQLHKQDDDLPGSETAHALT